MSYIDDTIARLTEKLPGCPSDVLPFYAQLVHTTGTATTRENVHDAWAVWRTLTRPSHPDLVPFSQLSEDVQAYDEKYVQAIREVAASLPAA